MIKQISSLPITCSITVEAPYIVPGPVTNTPPVLSIVSTCPNTSPYIVPIGTILDQYPVNKDEKIVSYAFVSALTQGDIKAKVQAEEMVFSRLSEEAVKDIKRAARNMQPSEIEQGWVKTTIEKDTFDQMMATIQTLNEVEQEIAYNSGSFDYYDRTRYVWSRGLSGRFDAKHRGIDGLFYYYRHIFDSLYQRPGLPQWTRPQRSYDILTNDFSLVTTDYYINEGGSLFGWDWHTIQYNYRWYTEPPKYEGLVLMSNEVFGYGHKYSVKVVIDWDAVDECISPNEGKWVCNPGDLRHRSGSVSHTINFYVPFKKYYLKKHDPDKWQKNIAYYVTVAKTKKWTYQAQEDLFEEEFFNNPKSSYISVHLPDPKNYTDFYDYIADLSQVFISYETNPESVFLSPAPSMWEDERETTQFSWNFQDAASGTPVTELPEWYSFVPSSASCAVTENKTLALTATENSNYAYTIFLSEDPYLRSMQGHESLQCFRFGRGSRKIRMWTGVGPYRKNGPFAIDGIRFKLEIDLNYSETWLTITRSIYSIGGLYLPPLCPDTWYYMRARLEDDCSASIKIWKEGTPEPLYWTVRTSYPYNSIFSDFGFFGEIEDIEDPSQSYIEWKYLSAGIYWDTAPLPKDTTFDKFPHMEIRYLPFRNLEAQNRVMEDKMNKLLMA